MRRSGSWHVDGLVDAITILGYGFIPGSPAPPCLDAADANGDGILSSLGDGLYLLGFYFLPGSPAPPAPYPECGIAGIFGCNIYKACPD